MKIKVESKLKSFCFHGKFKSLKRLFGHTIKKTLQHIWAAHKRISCYPLLTLGANFEGSKVCRATTRSIIFELGFPSLQRQAVSDNNVVQTSLSYTYIVSPRSALTQKWLRPSQFHPYPLPVVCNATLIANSCCLIFLLSKFFCSSPVDFHFGQLLNLGGGISLPHQLCRQEM